MISIRLKMIGRKKRHIFNIVAADSRSPRDGKIIEKIGFYDPSTKDIHINKDLYNKYKNIGARATQTVAKLISTINQ